ncbi:Proteasome subunit beta type-6 [Globisporangium polare]
MEYDGYFSNHLLHGVVALYELGAPREQIETFAEHYAKAKLETTAYDHEDPFELVVAEEDSSKSDAPVTMIPSAERVKELLGKREDFDALLAFYAHEVKLHGTDEAIRKHLPFMVGGLCGALLHGLIQLGYAYHIGGDRLIAEGLAYFHFSYLSFEDKDDYKNDSSSESLDEGTKKKQFTREEALQVAHAVKNHEFILSEMRAQLKTEPFADLAIGVYQRNLSALSAHPERGSAAAFQLISRTLDQFDFSEINGDVALDFSLWLYDMMEHSDFVIAHAVTSAWSLKQLEHLLGRDDLVRAWKVWFRVAVSAFIQQRVTDLSADDICDRMELELSTLDSWKEIIERTLALGGSTDEHVYKVVQVAHEHASTGDNKSSFLTQDEREFVARKAANKVISTDFQGP